MSMFDSSLGGFGREQDCSRLMWILEEEHHHVWRIFRETVAKRSHVAVHHMVATALANEDMLILTSIWNSSWLNELARSFEEELQRANRSLMAGFCWHCNKVRSSKAPLRTCAGCKRAKYCNKVCQHAAWESHKPWCQPCNNDNLTFLMKVPSSSTAFPFEPVPAWLLERGASQT